MTIGSLSSPRLSRRGFLTMAAVGAASLSISACTSMPRYARFDDPITPPPVEIDPAFGNYVSMYGAAFDEGFEVPAIPVDRIDPRFLRQVVADPTGERPGTIVVDTSSHFLYLVRENGQAMRYGVGLGRAGFEWSGRAVIQYKRKWPTWKVPADMIARDPSLEKYSVANGGMAPGLQNPLGARALYIFQDDVDTLYRIHGSPEWNSIGKSVSSGCVRLMNQDIIDLYDRVPGRAPVVVVAGLGVA
ncbi:MAG: L,D-transpeptidase [Pseudaminobacter sp.]|nr:L,D-transpeptidase [Pseudaminobacter sp.]